MVELGPGGGLGQTVELAVACDEAGGAPEPPCVPVSKFLADQPVYGIAGAATQRDGKQQNAQQKDVLIPATADRKAFGHVYHNECNEHLDGQRQTSDAERMAPPGAHVAGKSENRRLLSLAAEDFEVNSIDELKQSLGLKL